MWTPPVFISLFSAGLSLYVFIQQQRMKKADVFESRWFRFLERLQSMTFSKNDSFELDWVSETCLRIGLATIQGAPSLRQIAEEVCDANSETVRNLQTPDGLYGTFQSLAALREAKPLDKRSILDTSMLAYIHSKHVTHALYQALRHQDGKTIMFLIETGLLAKFASPALRDHIETLRKACVALTNRAEEAEDADSGSELSSEIRAAYRDRLLDTMESMELEYDKALLVLHPLGISVTSALFVSLLNAKTEIPNRHILFAAWSIWTLGVVLILVSFALSARMHKVAIQDWEERKEPSQNPHIKWLGIWTAITTYGSGLLFVAGIFVAAMFLIGLHQ